MMEMEVMMKELGEIITGNTPSKKTEAFWNSEDICFVKPDVIADNGIDEIMDANEYISEEAREKARVVGKNSIFVTCIGSIGKIGIASDGEYAFNQQINAIIPNKRVQPKYLAYNLLFNRPRLVAIANAPVVPIINKSQFGEFTVNIETDIDRQCEIVEVLDKLTQIIQQRNKEVIALDNLIKARFVEMFGNPLHPNKYLKLGEIAILERGRFSPRPRNDPKYFNGEYPFIQTGDISSSNHRLSEYKQTLNEQGIKVSKKFCVGTIVMAIVGATIGATAILEREVYAPDSVIGITPYNYNNVFLETLLQFWQPQLLANAPECARTNINLTILGEVPIIDVDVVLQNQFADFVNQVDKSKVEIQKALDKTQMLFNSLMQEYFG